MFDGEIVEEVPREPVIPFDAVRITLNNGRRFAFISDRNHRCYLDRYCRFKVLNREGNEIKEFDFPRENIMIVEVLPCSSYDEANDKMAEFIE